MERLVLVHGSVVSGRATWSAQRPLAERFELVVLDRPGFPPNPPVDRVDFESDAALVAGAPSSRRSPRRTLLRWRHLDARRGPAARRARLADGDRASGDPRRRRQPRRRRVRRRRRGAVRVGRDDDPETFLRRFLEAVGSRFDPPSPLPPDLAQGAQALTGRARAVGGGDPARRCSPPRRSRSSSSRGHTTPPSTRSATSSSASSPRNASCSPASATPFSCIPSSTSSSRTSSSERAEARRSGARWPRPARDPACARAGSRA